MKSILIGSLLLATQVHAAKPSPIADRIFIRTVAEQNKSTQLPDNWGQVKIEADQVWNQGVKGAGVLIGLTDSLVDVQNPQISPRIALNEIEAKGQPGVDDDNNGYVDDIQGWSFVDPNPQTFSTHGTAMAGILVADHTTGYIQGIAPEAKIIPAAFIDSVKGGSIQDAVLSIEYVISRGAKVIVMGWGGAPNMPILENVIRSHPDVLFVTAGGNDGFDLDVNPDYPAAYNFANMITIAASTETDMLAGWSNSGWNTIHLAAPGRDILTTYLNNRVGYISGTTISTAFVAGAAALLWSYKSTATVAQIKKALMDGVDVGPYPLKVQSQGRLNVAKSLAILKAM